jgi:Na+-translocating ferredoxin:NAD+ oxidoreductase RnfC subunit
MREVEQVFGENQDRLITIQCRVCGRWTAIRLDPDDFYRHVRDGVLVQRAFADRGGKPYLTAAERELFISAVCGSCYSLLCPSSELAYN